MQSDVFLLQLTAEQVRYLKVCLYRSTRLDKRGKEKIEKKFNEPVKDQGLINRLRIAKELSQILEATGI